MEIKENKIYSVNDPEIHLIQPIDINTLFVIGLDNSLYVKVFNHNFDLNGGKKDDFHLQKNEISLVKLYKFEGDVTDFYINIEQKILYVTDS